MKRTMRRRLWACERGAELIEFALVFPTLLLVLGGIVDLGFLFQRYEVVTNAAREGARMAALPDYEPNVQANVEARVSQFLVASGLTGTPGVVLSPKQPLSVNGHCIAVRTVTVTYDSNLVVLGPIYGLFGGGSTRQLRASSAMRLEIAGDSCS